MDHTTDDHSPKIRWDGTVTAGSLIAAVTMAITIIAAGSTALNSIGGLREEIKVVQGDQKNMQQDVTTVKIQLAQRDNQERRITELETRMRDVEVKKP